MFDDHDSIDISDLIFKRETDGAILVIAPDLGDVWLPKYAITIEPEYHREGDVVTVSMPEDLAEEKGLG